ncbi:MAG: terminase small subunit [Heliobacteriaceae bacterium]|jgi:phage terminase small subunit|nr:terminase small subunit [Heliobacteriaceae bacterium]
MLIYKELEPMKLRNREKKFVTEYIKSLDAEFCAQKAGYKNLKAARKLLANPLVIKEIKSQLKEQIVSLKVDKGYVIEKLLRIAEFSLEEEDVLDKEGAFTGRKKLRDTSAGLKALEGLCKYLGFNADDKEYKQAKIITIANLDDNKI